LCARSRSQTHRFISTVTGSAVLARDPDGSCSLEHVPLHEVDMIKAAGTLSF